jgi:predicted NAD/FAD-binding protein
LLKIFNLIGLFEELNVEGIPTEMGFSVSMDDGSFEWCADSVSGLLATPSNIINPSFLLMFGDIVRFNKKALELLRLPSHHIDKHMTTGDFLKKYKFSDAFSKVFLH